jgi:predicted glutamine amidotransferase
MCRIAMFPPNFPKEKAIEILKTFESYNKDGVGSVYVNNRKFIVDKHPTSLSALLEKGHDFLSHMPYNGWTLAHLRAASHGGKAHRNTHPFIIGGSAFIHNGVWRDYNIAKPLLEQEVSFKGETDTEVAGHYLRKIGAKRFLQEIDFGGVFVSLKRNGKLEIVKTSGDLTVFKRSDGTYLIASTLDSDKYKNQKEWEEGWYRFSKHGKLTGSFIKPIETFEIEDEDDDDDEEENTYCCDEGANSASKFTSAGNWEFVNGRWIKNYTPPVLRPKSKVDEFKLWKKATQNTQNPENVFKYSVD